MNFSTPRYHKGIRLLACILILTSIFAGLYQGLSEKNEMRIEDWNYFDTTDSGTAYAFSNKYMLSARAESLIDWTPTQFSIVMTEIHSGKTRDVETISASEIHLFSDSNLFYIAALAKYPDQDYKDILNIGIFDSGKEKIDWHKSISIKTDFQINEKLCDIVLINNNLILIFPKHVVIYNTAEKKHNCIFFHENRIVNHYFLNHACVLGNEVFLQDASGDIQVLNADDGSYRSLDIRSKVYRAGKYDAELGRYKYYIYDSHLIYPESYGSFEQMVAYSLLTNESHVIFDGSFSIYFHDENGLYIDMMDYGTGKYLFSPDTNELQIITKKQLQPLERIKNIKNHE